MISHNIKPYISILPPTSSIAALAPLVTLIPFKATALEISPEAITLTLETVDAIRPACFKTKISISLTAIDSSSLKRSCALADTVKDLKPL